MHPSITMYTFIHSFTFVVVVVLHNTFLNSLKGFTHVHNRTHQLQVHILTRFEVSDYNSECDAVCRLLVQIRCGRKSKTRFHVFSGLNPFKAPGPDGPRGRALSTCTPLLGPLLARLLQLFLDSMSVPRAWKSSFIIVNTS